MSKIINNKKKYFNKINDIKDINIKKKSKKTQADELSLSTSPLYTEPAKGVVTHDR